MKKFPKQAEGQHSKMPKITPQRPGGSAEQQLPQPCSQQKHQIKTKPQFPPAQGKGAEKPGKKQLQTDQQLTKPGESAVEGLEHIRSRAQQHPHKKASRQPLPGHLRGHLLQPRRSRGSS